MYIVLFMKKIDNNTIIITKKGEDMFSSKVAPEQVVVQTPRMESRTRADSDSSVVDYKISCMTKLWFCISNCFDRGATQAALDAFKAEISPIKQDNSDSE